nr:MAG TPA: hypothetical protein [Caudoviricetes sp.]
MKLKLPSWISTSSPALAGTAGVRFTRRARCQPRHLYH